jgi:hypothetical protein
MEGMQRLALIFHHIKIIEFFVSLQRFILMNLCA